MAFQTIYKPTRVSRSNSPGGGVRIIQHGGGAGQKTPPTATFRLGPAAVAAGGFKAGDRISVKFGDGEHAGKILLFKPEGDKPGMQLYGDDKSGKLTCKTVLRSFEEQSPKFCKWVSAVRPDSDDLAYERDEAGLIVDLNRTLP